jgi:hypothetical protein
MNFDSPIDKTYIDDVDFKNLIEKARKKNLSDIKLKLNEHNLLQEPLFDEIMSKDNAQVLKKKKKLQILKDASKRLQAQA